MSIKNRWYSAKGRYGAVQTPWRQRSLKEKVLQCSTAQGWYSASTMMRSLKKQRQDAFLLITSLRGHPLASPVSKREINKAGALKMPRSQLLLIVLLLAPLASAITLQTNLIEGSFKIKVKKKSENHYFYHIKSIKDV